MVRVIRLVNGTATSEQAFGGRCHCTVLGKALVPSAKHDAAASPKTVLVVEDEVLVRMMIADALRDGGFSVVEAANADEAMAVLRSGADIALVFTDVRMPGSMDGLDLARLVFAQHPDSRVIVTSGHVAPLALPQGAGPLISKPYDPAEVVKTISGLLSPEQPK